MSRNLKKKTYKCYPSLKNKIKTDSGGHIAVTSGHVNKLRTSIILYPRIYFDSYFELIERNVYI